MCFSANVSFGAGIVLAGTGAIAMARVKTWKMLPFASTPLFFGLQQVVEGIYWLSGSEPAWVPWQGFLSQLYLIIAFVVWPIYVPIGSWLMEPDPGRKRKISYAIWVGAACGAYFLYMLLSDPPVGQLDCAHIQYNFWVPFKNLFFDCVLGWYVAAMIAPLFLSSFRGMKLMGAAILGSLALSMLIYTQFVISVWCFFSAILSVIVIYVVVVSKGRPPLVPAPAT